MVLRKNVLFGTILDNLRWGDENASEEECIRVAKLACADGVHRALPDVVQYLDQAGGRLQRVRRPEAAPDHARALRKPRC